ncbi:MAG: glutamine amidotransferase [Coriobacteriia bacterium]|nr:glutamine amidotransferase [Coriobacteriia bacterium]
MITQANQAHTAAFPALTLVQLYPWEMSVNGDAGNLQTLQRRLQWRSIPSKLVRLHPGDPFPSQADLIVGGGGQITSNSPVTSDLLRIKEPLREAIESGVPALVTGGSYQLFGNYLQTIDNRQIEGAAIFNLHTQDNTQRLTGNVIAQSEQFGVIVGFENHSGRTWLGAGINPLARVTQGGGNNNEDKTEGARYHNAVGSYLFGPLLPLNPGIADFLIVKALEHCLGEPFDPQELTALPAIDACAAQAAAIVQKRSWNIN